MSSPYPALHYPEIYLLHNGYKEFFENNSDLCEPHAYRQMLDSNFSNEYKHFRAKSKSWGGDARAPGTVRLTKSRSRLVL
jgi:M-phase inducer phosphatase